MAGRQNSGASTSEKAVSDAPIVALVIGMAGSGKTTLMQQMNAYMGMTKKSGYLINLDPAVLKLPYEPNIDIRDTVNYKNVMKEYGLGPNGGILTACNLFATRFDQVMALCERVRDPPLEHIMVDTAGQIEIFTWSASGNIVTDVFASTFPTVIIFVIDTPRCTSPQTFMSNMVQACSILYKTKLPLILAFNKVDVVRHNFALEWMRDFDSFSAALDVDSSYAASLSRSLALVLDEFYESLASVGVSSVTGEGMPELFEALRKGAGEYSEYYKPDLEARKAKRRKEDEERRAADLRRVAEDIEAVRAGERDVLVSARRRPSHDTNLAE